MTSFVVSVGEMTEDQRLQELSLKISQAEERLEAVTDQTIVRVKKSLYTHKVYTGKFHTMPADYYARSLEERVGMLGAKSTGQLCKSILFENTFFEANPAYTDAPFLGNSKFYLVVVQYVSKINMNMLSTLVHELTPKEHRLAKKKFHFRLVEEKVSYALSGFKHNAISPYGMLTPNIPVIVCRRCLDHPIIYLGGGEVEVKLSLPISDFITSVNGIVGKVSEPR